MYHFQVWMAQGITPSAMPSLAVSMHCARLTGPCLVRPRCLFKALSPTPSTPLYPAIVLNLREMTAIPGRSQAASRGKGMLPSTPEHDRFPQHSAYHLRQEQDFVIFLSLSLQYTQRAHDPRRRALGPKGGHRTQLLHRSAQFAKRSSITVRVWSAQWSRAERGVYPARRDATSFSPVRHDVLQSSTRDATPLGRLLRHC